MGTVGVLSFGTMNTAQNRFFWRGVYSAGTIYNPYDVVSYLGSAYIALTTQSGVLPTNTGSWDQMTSSGSVTSVAGRVGNVVLSSADLSDKDAANGVAGLDANAFLKPAEFNQTINAQTGTTYTVVAADRAKLLTLNNAGAVAVTLPQATGSFGSGWYCYVENLGASLVTITPTTSTVDGATTVTLKQFESIRLVSNGTNYLCLRSKVRASFADITGTIGTGQITPTTATSHQFLTAIASDGTATKAQPAFTDISGTVAPSQLPAPTASTLGGVASQVALAHSFMTGINTSGFATVAQPASTDLSDVATLATLTGTQSLSNKTLTGPSSINTVTSLNFQGTAAAITGNSTDQVLYTYTLPANTLRAGKSLVIEFDVLQNQANSATYKVRINGTVVMTLGTASAVAHMGGRIRWGNNAGVTNAQSGMAWASGGSLLATQDFQTAVSTTANVTFDITSNTASPNTTTPKIFAVTLDQ